MRTLLTILIWCSCIVLFGDMALLFLYGWFWAPVPQYIWAVSLAILGIALICREQVDVVRASISEGGPKVVTRSMALLIGVLVVGGLALAVFLIL
ncbi:hypothetical protein [Sneathiella chinensis]|uniref:Uncharacterized protein n=1 Tax=Sneathiella chinensis TaxID=349750 RepID=A0ABQ5U1K3_9PROT|nr:hypothetical protein [Sneathiella chinensis]GLQ06062.1 hypothetical protein GCM10007924_12830 [Sneathiella chinensis]